MLRATLAFTLAGLTFSALADTVPAPVNAKVKMTAGQPVVLSFSDGREAELKVVNSRSRVVSEKIEITGSDCGNWGMTCNYKFAFRRFWVAMIWTKNPDASRLGQAVQRAFANVDSNGKMTVVESSFEELIIDSGFISGLIPKAYPKIAAGLPRHQLQCSDFSWLPAGTKEAPAQQRFTRWETVDNRENPETGLSENRPQGGVQELVMTRVKPDTLEITSALNPTGLVHFFDLVTLAPMLDLAIAQPDNNICQASLSTLGTTEFRAVYDELESKRASLAIAPSYIYGQDETLDLISINQYLTFWFRLDLSNAVYR